jgi:ureidoglycolate lyase
MGYEHIVIAEELSVGAFAPYGQAILQPTTPAPITGTDWECWVALGELGEGNPSVGIVVTRPVDNVVKAMEREPKTEFLIPITGPVIQTVALPGDLADHSQQPLAETVRAFVVRPGQAVVMAAGTWHSAALPLAGETMYYFMTEPHPPEPGREASPWVSFARGDTIRIQKPR